MKYKWPLMILFLFLIACNLLPSFLELTGSQNSNLAYIFWQIRLPTTLMAIIAGITLSLTGLNYQYLFQNHLASPYTLGMASAAAFGSSFFLILQKQMPWLPDQIQSLVSMAMAALTVFTLMRFLRQRKGSLYKVLLGGIAASLLFSSFIILIQYVLGNRDGFELMVSLLGQLSMVGYKVVLISGALALLLVFFTFKNFNTLRLLSVNYDFAISQNKESDKVFKQTILIPSIVTAYLVSELGPISFVGLVVPHVVRLLFKPVKKQEVFLNVLLGPVFLMICDLIARFLLPGQELPVGVTTSIIGGAFLVFMLF